MRTALCIAALLAGAGVAHADEIEQWNELGVSTDVAEHTSVDLEAEIRFDEEADLIAAMPDLSVEQELEKWLRVGGGYRLQYARNNDDEMVVRHRFYVFGKLKKKFDDVQVSYRLQLQEQLRPGANEFQRHMVRNKLDVDYRRWKPWVPGASAELFTAIDDGQPLTMDRVRLVATAMHDRKDQSFGLFYGVELPIADRMEPVIHILGLSVGFDL